MLAHCLRLTFASPAVCGDTFVRLFGLRGHGTRCSASPEPLARHVSGPGQRKLYSPVAGDDVVPPEVHAAIEHNTNRNATHPEHRDVGPQDPLACELLQHVKGRVDLVLVTVRVRDDGDTGPWSAGYRFQVEP